MKKLAFFSLVLFFLPFTAAKAQFKIGLRAGISTSNLDRETVSANGMNLAIKEAKYGYHMGLFLRGNLSKHLYLQPEFLFNTNTVDFTWDELNDNVPGTLLSESYQNLDIPLMVGYKLGPLRFEGGPVGHIHIASSSDLGDIGGYQQRFNDFELGYQVGGGLDIWRLLLDVRYEGNFNNFGEHMRIGGQEVAFSQNPSRIVMTVGFAF